MRGNKMRRLFWILPILTLIVVPMLLFLNCSEESQQKTRNEKAPHLKTGFFDVGKTELYYEEMGEGHPLILLHGGLLDCRMWDDQFETFAKKFRVIRYDVRNHGNSKGVPDTFKHYEDLLKIIEQLNLEKAVLLGLSLGGRTAIDFAIAYPERVSAVILASPGASGYEFKSDAFKKNNARLQKAFKEGNIDMGIEYFQQAWTDGPYRKPDEIDPSVRAKVRDMALNTFKEWENESVAEELEPPAIGRLDEIQAPTLVIVGDLDMPGIMEIANSVKEKVPGAEKVVIPGAAHMVKMEKPNEFNKAVFDFLAKLDFQKE
jgi:3-oxoadipate enol-lactonase